MAPLVGSPSCPTAGTLPVSEALLSGGVTGFWHEDGNLFEYPPAFCIQNTFIDCKYTRSPSLDEFFTERQVRSCPCSQTDASGRDGEDVATTCIGIGSVPVGNLQLGIAHSGREGAPPSTSAGSSAGASRGEEELEEVSETSVPRVESMGSLTDAATPLSIGSAQHGVRCKPCAFFHTKGCESGRDCVFCHECGPFEKKRRHKEKVENRKLRNQARAGLQAIASTMLQRAPVALGFMPWSMGETAHALAGHTVQRQNPAAC